MNLFDALILAVVQGLTEFLPVSSSAHLVFAKALLGLHTEGVVWEVSLHVGTLFAVVLFLRRELWQAICGFFAGAAALASGASAKSVWEQRQDFRLACYVILGTIPAGLVGVLFHEPLERMFGSPLYAAIFLFITGEILWLTRSHNLLGTDRKLTWVDSVWIGLGQAVAILPGISRSGTTISVALFRDVNREQAARFSFLLSVPIILGAGLMDARKIGALPHSELALLLIGVLTSAAVGYLALLALLRVIKAGRLHYFSYYCWTVSLAAVAYFWYLAGRQ